MESAGSVAITRAPPPVTSPRAVSSASSFRPPADASRGCAKDAAWCGNASRRRLQGGEPPSISLFAGVAKVRLPDAFRGFVEPPLTIRTTAGGIHDEYATVRLAFGFPPGAQDLVS